MTSIERIFLIGTWLSFFCVVTMAAVSVSGPVLFPFTAWDAFCIVVLARGLWRMHRARMVPNVHTPEEK